MLWLISPTLAAEASPLTLQQRTPSFLVLFAGPIAPRLGQCDNSPMLSNTPLVFISYAREDERWKKRFLRHLAVLERQEQIDVWTDQEIPGGTDWKAALQAKIERADIAVLLVSQHFLGSKFIMEWELPKILEQSERCITILPLLVRPCAWKTVDCLQRLALRPQDGKALATRLNQVDKLLKEVVEELATRLDTHPKVRLDLSEVFELTELRKDSTELLTQTIDRMQEAQRTIRRDAKPYSKGVRDLKEQLRKLNDLELRMAVVAPMKAGKSTIVNALVGENLLPARTAAMTTIPTEISHSAHEKIPCLTLTRTAVETFSRALTRMQGLVRRRPRQVLRQQTAQFPQVEPVVDLLRDTNVARILQKSRGAQAIQATLLRLNDISRLTALLLPAETPLRTLRADDVPRIETTFWPIQGDDKVQHLGKLVLVDTPGPDEAILHRELEPIVAVELRRSSMVLLVLDFTQLNNLASARVHDQVRDVINALGRDSLLVLVNKIDQRRQDAPSTAEVQDFIRANLRLESIAGRHHVFEVSGLWAFRAAEALRALRESPGEVKIWQSPAACRLMQEMHPFEWEALMPTLSPQDIETKAQLLWDRSGFAAFLEYVRVLLTREIAPKCIVAAMANAEQHLRWLENELGSRIGDFKAEAKELADRLANVERERRRATRAKKSLERSVRTAYSELQADLQSLFRNLRDRTIATTEAFHGKKEKQRPKFLKLFNDRRLAGHVGTEGTDVITCETKEDADVVMSVAYQHAWDEANEAFATVRGQTREMIGRTADRLQRTLKAGIKGVLPSFQDHLVWQFDITLRLNPSISPQEIFETTKGGVIYVEQAETRWWEMWFPWLKARSPAPEPVPRPAALQKRFLVDLNHVTKAVNREVADSTTRIEEELGRFLRENAKEAMQTCTDAIDEYFQRLTLSLQRSQGERRLSLDNQQRRVGELTGLRRNVIDLAERVGTARHRAGRPLAGRRA
jgi:hypothetical protein